MAGRRDSETPVPPLQLVAFSLSTCIDRATDCCLAQVSKRVSQSQLFLDFPLSLTKRFDLLRLDFSSSLLSTASEACHLFFELSLRAGHEEHIISESQC